ncbi:hypothetical protein [Amycolatopsis sp. NPDC003861]
MALLPEVAATLASLRMIEPPAEPSASVPGGPPPVPLVDPPTKYEPDPSSGVLAPPRVEWPSRRAPAEHRAASRARARRRRPGDRDRERHHVRGHRVTAVTPSGGGAIEPPPVTDPAPVDPSAE